ncbi:hypothetical protein Scep_029642 [Stephania cephalantha]|uniref:Dolichyl-diphosphooligosaccharide--protein glycosyltransferase subunit 2 n=1 Tax=Stephania cephalantha TaxID=152367 RepID=A0AAP0DY45_9MAGN
MSRNLGFLFLILSLAICQAAIFEPVSDKHRSAALHLFRPVDGSFGSLEESYESLRTFEILGVKKFDVSQSTCPLVVKTLEASPTCSKDLFDALRVNRILRCEVEADIFEKIASKLQTGIREASSLLDFYYGVGSLGLIKEQSPETNVQLSDASTTFHSIKSLSQSDGRWLFSFGSVESSTYAAGTVHPGLALETLAGVISLASSELDQSMIGAVKSDIVKLFDSTERYDDGSLYFDDKLLDTHGHQGPISTTSAVVRGVTSFSAVISGKLNVSYQQLLSCSLACLLAFVVLCEMTIKFLLPGELLPGDKILGLARFFLGIGVPGNAKDLFTQIDSVACLEDNKISIPLILSLPATVLSLTKKDQLKVKVNTVLGSSAPPLTVKLVQAFSSDKKEIPVLENQKLNVDPESSDHSLDILSSNIDIGKYIFSFRVVLHESENKKIYATGGQTQVPIFITGFINVDSSEISILDSDLGSIETKQKLDLSGKTSLSLSANHLQKLSLHFELTTPHGNSFHPHQVLLKLSHESKVEHVFLVGNSGRHFEILLDFLGLVEKFYYLSGKYDMQLTVGDVAMENSFLIALGHVELDLPQAPEKAPRPPPQPVDPSSIYGPKQEIIHIFRATEKRPPQELSLAFLGLTVLPFFAFLIGLVRLGVNLKNFPSSALPATFALLFHCGIAAVLSLYLLFWLKLDLFTTLKALGFLGIFLLFVGHRTLSHLASMSTKLKSA